MRVAVLTTQTPHHAWFVRELARDVDALHVLIERDGVHAPFDTGHPFETTRDQDECAAWFGGNNPRLEEFAPSSACGNINDPAAAAVLRDLAPDLVLVFGTRKLLPPLIAAAGPLVLNLHGGDPEYYRGLDSHLWAIYHHDFANLVTTLHHLTEGLDQGAIVDARPVPLSRDMKLHQLRRVNTETALCLSRRAVQEYRDRGRLPARPQRCPGRYYSFMPAVLKELCVARFERHTASLP